MPKERKNANNGGNNGKPAKPSPPKPDETLANEIRKGDKDGKTKSG
jgi:hypothetical protein